MLAVRCAFRWTGPSRLDIAHADANRNRWTGKVVNVFFDIERANQINLCPLTVEPAATLEHFVEPHAERSLHSLDVDSRTKLVMRVAREGDYALDAFVANAREL